MIKIRLTPAQVSALQCSCLDIPETETERLLADAWVGPWLTFRENDLSRITSGLTDLANAEDSNADALGCRAARGASVALTNLVLKIVRI